MSYRIVYGPEKEMCATRKHRQPWIALGILAVMFLGVQLAGFGEVLRRWLMPGDAEITEAALETLAENLQQGVNLRQAVTAFCKEILIGGGIQ